MPESVEPAQPAAPSRRPHRTPLLTRRHAALGLAGAGLAAYFAGPATAAPARSTSRRARIAAAERVSARILDLEVDSPALGGTGRARVLLPDGWDADPDRRWPVIYLLHGCCDAEGWKAWAAADRITAQTPALVVTPEGGPAGFYADWWNQGDYGPPAWETFHLTELRGLLERDLRASDQRAIAGLSMGGHGALSYAGRHPDLFRAAASFSGVVHTQSWTDGILGIVSGTGVDGTDLWGDPEAQADLWRAHNAYELAAELPQGFPVYLSCGDGQPGPLDPPDREPDSLEADLHGHAVAYIDRARSLGLEVTADLYGAGTHSWPYWERALTNSLPLLAESIGATA